MDDQHLIHMLNSILKTLCYHCNSQICQAANAVFDLAVMDRQENLVGMVFHNKEELEHYLPYFISLVGKLPEDNMAQGEEEDLKVWLTF